MEKPIYTYVGRVKIGSSLVFSWGGSGFERIKFFNDRLVASAFPRKKTILYSEIDGLEWSTAGYVRIKHHSKGSRFVAFFLFGKYNPELLKIYKILKNHGVPLKREA